MKSFKTTIFIDAIQLIEEHFLQGNDELSLLFPNKVWLDQVTKSASLNYQDKGTVGDWIVRKDNGDLTIIDRKTFRKEFTEI